MKLDMDELPTEAVVYIAKLRQEAARARIQKNGAQAEADRLRAELAELKSARADV